MNDVSKEPLRDLTLKLDWLNDQDQSADGQRVVVELQRANGLPVASLSAPCDQLLQAISQKLNCYPLLSPDGIVSVVSDETAVPMPSAQSITLDKLIADGISSDMLDDEPNAANMLSELRVRLRKSLELVEQVIASVLKD